MWDNMGAYSLNNYGDLVNDDIAETQPNSPTIFYFTSQNYWFFKIFKVLVDFF